MDLKECYAAIGGDYEGVVGRLCSEKIVKKFVLKFLNDASYGLLIKSLAEENYDEAFRASHTIKGICQNLGFDKLGDSSSRLTEVLRGGSIAGSEGLVEEVKADYQMTADAIRKFEAESEG